MSKRKQSKSSTNTDKDLLCRSYDVYDESNSNSINSQCWLFNTGRDDPNQEIFFREWMFENVLLDKSSERFVLLFEFGKTLSQSTTVSSVHIRKSLQMDSVLNVIGMMLVDTIAFVDADLFEDFRYDFIYNLFPKTSVMVKQRYGELCTLVNFPTYLITTGDIIAILYGLTSTRKASIRKGFHSTLRHLTVEKIRTQNDSLVCIGTSLIELFWYANVSVKPSPDKGLIGLYSNANYADVVPNCDGLKQRMCIGLNLRTKCMNTYSTSHLHVSLKNKVVKSQNGRSSKIVTTGCYPGSRNDRGIFGVVYACNSSIGKCMHNCYCIDAHNVQLNMFVRDETGMVLIQNDMVEISFLSLTDSIYKGDELLWRYDHSVKNKLSSLEVYVIQRT
jgi:hypothetical protein